MVVEHSIPTYYVLLMTINVTLTLIVMLAACLCCKKKVPKNDLLGLEGMVKLKNPDEVIVTTTVGNSESQADLNASTVSNTDSEKRASVAAHRSLPDIPVSDLNGGDNGSELYETVADKRLIDEQNKQDKSPMPSLKKQTSVSQHSSISQADDVSSPYSRVKNLPHDYAKVRTTEHPYAQLNAPNTSNASAASAAAVAVISASASDTNAAGQLTHTNDSLNRSSHHSNASQLHADNMPQPVEIPAASAIAGMISASQDLPYMTPPIANQHFSGDSQDSSKGYTSISVREPLANILAQQPLKPAHRAAQLARDVNDSHYATVSDDSDETYAAIEDPTGRNNINTAADIYTSGSETYAQIQPMQPNSIVVSVEINNLSHSHVNANNALQLQQLEQSATNNAAKQSHQQQSHNQSNRSSSEHANTPIPPPVDSLRAHMHSRQASSSSNNSSSMGNLGSPKPEKRQANSPLPPTPKSSSSQQQQTSSNSNLTSGRNSVISVIECGGGGIGNILENASALMNNTTNNIESTSPQKKNKSSSPSKDIEGMYAKVMKKNKFSRNSPSSQNSSPIMSRKYDDHHHLLTGVSPLDSAAAELMQAHKINVITGSGGNGRVRSNSYGAKDHGYETIPADAIRNNTGIENRKSDCYANILQKERQQEGAHLITTTTTTSSSSPNTNTKLPPTDCNKTATSRLYRGEKHYETIKNSNDPGYETLLKHNKDNDLEKKSSDYDPNYEVLKVPNVIATNSGSGLSDDGYAKVIEKKRLNIDEEDSTDGYSKVKGDGGSGSTTTTGGGGGYSTIGEIKSESEKLTDANHNYASILETKGALANDLSAAADTESDHYAHIAEALLPAAVPPELPPLIGMMSSTPNKLHDTNGTADGNLMQHSTPPPPPPPPPQAHRLPELPLVSPSSFNSSSLLNSSGTTSSTNTTTATSLSTSISSRQTPTSSSQYESLTGSDTDPNYESVCYVNAGDGDRENPYERLHTDDYSDTQLSSPLTPEEQERLNGTPKSIATASAVKTVMANGPKVGNSNMNNTTTTDLNATDIVVDDYFQV